MVLSVLGGKMKKLIFVFFMVSLLIIIIGGCSTQKEKTKDLTPYFKNLKNYSLDMDMTVQNDKQKINYEGKQIYSSSLGYRLELNKERVLIYKNNKIYVSDLVNGQNYIKDDSMDDIYRISFVEEFIKLLYTKGEKDISFKDIAGGKYEIINVSMPNNNRNLSRGALYVNLQEKAPRVLVLYDTKGNQKIIIKYSNFNSEVNIDKKLFNTN
jgi:outer membrane lipoprotein-sorting protein